MSSRTLEVEQAESREKTAQPGPYRSVSGRVELFSPDERRERGRAQRVAVPRMSHETFKISAYRPDPVQLLEEQGEGRLQHLLPIRYARMMESPFAFFRGSAAVMAWDLSHTPSTKLKAQLCGDAHVSNFGFFGSPERVLMFDINDFDETMPGPFEWDVKRLATSTVLAGRYNGFSESTCRDIAQACVHRYQEKLAEFAGMTTLEIWYSHVTAESLLGFISKASKRKDMLAKIEKARAKDSHYAIARMTEVTDGELRIVERPPLVERLPEEEANTVVHPIFDKYMESLQPDRRDLLDHYRYVDSAIRVGGVGSVGMRCYMVVLVGRDNSDPLVLQLKESVNSVLAPYVQNPHFRNEGERVVHGQRLIQAVSDPFLGWVRSHNGRDLYFRQLFNMKASADLAAMKPSLFTSYACVCGEILARAHARSGDQIQLSAYLGKNNHFEEAIARFSMLYADQAEKDYELLVDAVKSGRLPSQPVA